MPARYRLLIVACVVSVFAVARADDPVESGRWVVRHALAHKSPVAAVAYHDGLVAAGDRRGALLVWDAKAGTVKQTVLDGTNKQVTGVERVQFAPDGEWLFAVTNDGYGTHQWSVKGGGPLHTDLDPKEQWRAHGVTPDGRAWVYGVGTRTLTVLRYAIGAKGQPALVEGQHVHKELIDLAAIGEDNVLVTVASGVLRRMEANGENPVWQVTLNKIDPVRVAVGPGGKVVAVAGQNGEVRLHSAQTGNAVGKLTGHKGPVWALAFSRDGKRLVTGGEDRTVRVWDADAGKELAVLKDHTAPVLAAAFGPDGETFATAGEDKTVKVWERTK
jgi:WD40 repeat protein